MKGMTMTSSIIERHSASLGDAASDDALFARLLDAAAALRPLVAKRARQTEQDRRVSSEVTNLLKDAGLYRVV
jgi:resorcinol 4-hydroxylase (FADH2)